MIKYFTIEDLLKHYLQKKFHILADELEDTEENIGRLIEQFHLEIPQ